MSIIPKIWNLCNCKNIVSNVASNINGNLKCGNIIFQRLLSKRFTIGRDCKKPKPKQAKCEDELSKKHGCRSKENADKECPDCQPEKRSKLKPGKPAVIDVCTPFRKKEKKRPSKSNIKKKPKCTAGMKNPCEEDVCTPHCSLTKGKGQLSCNECPKEEGSGPIKSCPKGNWQQGE